MRLTQLFALAACSCLTGPAFSSTLQIDTSSWSDPFVYFLDNWQHHSGLYIETDPVFPSYFTFPNFNDNPGLQFDTALSQPVEFGLATNKVSVWDTALLGPVGTIRFVLQARVYSSEGAEVDLGALVFNSTTGEFFRAMVNGLSSNWELADRLLMPADFCLMQTGGGCDAITGFGDGILQFGYAVRTDSTNEQQQYVEVEFDDANNFLIQATSADVPEPSTMAMAGAGLIALGLARRRRRS